MGKPRKDYSRQRGAFAIVDNNVHGYSGYKVVVALWRDKNENVLVARWQKCVASVKTVQEAQDVIDRWQRMNTQS